MCPSQMVASPSIPKFPQVSLKALLSPALPSNH